MPHQCTNCGRTFADGSKEMLSGCPDCSGTKFQFRPDGIDDDGDEPATAESTAAATPDPGSSPDESPPEPTGDAVSRTVGSAAATVRDLVTGSAEPDATTASPRADAESADAGTAPAAGNGTASTGTACETVDGGTIGDDDDIIVAESEPLDESDAQADARSEIVEPDEMPDTDGFDPTTDDEVADPADESEDAAGADTATGAASTGAAPAAETDGESADAAAIDRSVAEEPDVERSERPDLAELREELNEQFESIRVVEPGQYELNLMELYDREEYIIALQEDGRYSIQVPETWRDGDD